MPVSAVGQDLPISYFNEDDNMAKFMDPTQESTVKECDVSRSMVSDAELSCMTFFYLKILVYGPRDFVP